MYLIFFSQNLKLVNSFIEEKVLVRWDLYLFLIVHIQIINLLHNIMDMNYFLVIFPWKGGIAFQFNGL